MKNSTLSTHIKTRKKSLVIIFIFAFSFGLFLSLVFQLIKNYDKESNSLQKSIVTKQSSSPSLSPTPTLPSIPASKNLDNGGYHIFQSFNNCGPASLSMALRFYGIEVSQEELGNELRPFQVAGGNNDDKSVTLEELAKKVEEYGFIPYHRPMGNPEIVKNMIAAGIPIIARTWLKPDEDIGHYRVVKGYDENNRTYIQDDSLQNKNLTFSYEEFDRIWKKFNYEYLILVPPEKQELVKRVLGENTDKKAAWEKAVDSSLQKLEENPNDVNTRFNLSVAYYNIDEFQKSVKEFEKVENGLSFRTLWYQIEPIKAYYKLGNYDRVFEITDRILNNQNRAFSELYIIRGKIYQSQGKIDLARQSYENAVFYNQNLKEAKELLKNINMP
jgi:predicted double-glycine peptidase